MRNELKANLRKLVYQTKKYQTVSAMAEEFGVSRIAFYNWMRTGNMSVRRVEELAKFFGVKESYLLRKVK